MRTFDPHLLTALPSRSAGRVRNFATLSDARSGVAVARITGGALLFLHLTLLPSFTGQSFLMERARLRSSGLAADGFVATIGREFFAWGFIVAIGFSLVVMLAPLIARGTRVLGLAAAVIGLFDLVAIIGFPGNRVTGGTFTPSLVLGVAGCALASAAFFMSVGEQGPDGAFARGF